MNTDTVKGSWKDIKGQIKAKWGKLTDDDLKQAEGHIDQLAGALQRRYGYEKEEANRKVDEFMGRVKQRVDGPPHK